MLTVGEDRYMIGDDCLSPYQRLSASDALSPLSDTSGNIHDRYVDVYSPQQDASMSFELTQYFVYVLTIPIVYQ